MCNNIWQFVIWNLCMQGALKDTDRAPLLFNIKFERSKSYFQRFLPTLSFLILQTIDLINIVNCSIVIYIIYLFTFFLLYKGCFIFNWMILFKVPLLHHYISWEMYLFYFKTQSNQMCHFITFLWLFNMVMVHIHRLFSLRGNCV